MIGVNESSEMKQEGRNIDDMKANWVKKINQSVAVLLSVMLLAGCGAASKTGGNAENVQNSSNQEAQGEISNQETQAENTNPEAESELSTSGNAEITGFHVQGTQLLDANGNPFIMRGINHAHTWFASEALQAFTAIKETGSNTIRIVLSNGEKFTRNSQEAVAALVSRCKQDHEIAVLEVHDATGSNDIQDVLAAAQYFVDIKDALIGEEAYVIINIANEWVGSWDSGTWYKGYSEAVAMLREAGLTHTLMIDAGGWGQYGKCIDDYGTTLLEEDPLHNLMFSVHMYGTAGGSEKSIDDNMGYVLNNNLCLVIGEFGYTHSDGDVQEGYLMQRCEELGVGYLAWSWKGNGGGVEYLDLAIKWDGSQLSEDWGEVVINGPNGIRETSVICSVFEE